MCSEVHKICLNKEGHNRNRQLDERFIELHEHRHPLVGRKAPRHFKVRQVQNPAEAVNGTNLEFVDRQNEKEQGRQDAGQR